MVFLIIILILGIFFLYVLPRMLPWLLTALVKRQVKRQMKNAFGRNGANGWQNGRNGEEPQQAKPRKKIDPSVGEYVQFEEITVHRTTETVVDEDGHTEVERTTVEAERRTTVVESQIVDAEWEDIV